MSDTRPVIVIHGIGNRDRQAFSQTVAEIGRDLGPRWQTFDFFWGDLGGISEGLADALPMIWPPSVNTDATFTRELAAVRADLMSPDGRALTAAEIIRSVAVGPVEAPQSAVRTAETRDQRELRERTGQAIEDAVAATRYLRLLDDPASLQAIGQLVSNAIELPDSDGLSGSAVRSGRSGGLLAGTAWIRDRVTRVIGLVDELVGQLTSGVGGTMNQLVRRSLARPIALTLGDIVGYHQNRPRILERLFAFIDERLPGVGVQGNPVSIMAHSLGGLLVLDAALGAHQCRPLWVDQLVTFGSQPAFFHIMTPRDGLQAYQPGRRSRLPPTIRRWRNLWHPLDPLAFVVAPVFELSDGSIPEDLIVRTGARTIAEHELWLHSVYWRSPELVRAMVSD